MKTTIGKIFTGTLLASSLIIFACQKKPEPTPAPVPVVTYTTLSDFYNANAVKSQFFNIDAAAGGSFVTTQGTKVTIKPNSFVDLLNNTVSGMVKVEFKDIYKKSDMLLSQMPVMLGNGAPLKSGGEFFIKVTKDSNAVNLAHKTAIVVQQPANGFPIDSSGGMKPFVFANGAGGNGWAPSFGDTISGPDSLRLLVTSYVFSLYTFSSPVGNGTWCNSDNSSYFSSYPQTTLNIIPDFTVSDYGANVYLIFKGINSMVHVYDNGSGQYPYTYAPTGLSCTIVAIAVKDKSVYSSFTDITISANQTVHIPISVTTESDFKTKLTSLDN